MCKENTATAFLGVETSLKGRRWIGPGCEQDRLSEGMAQRTGLPLLVCRVLVRRGVQMEEAKSFLTPALRDSLPDPRRLKDMQTAAARFLIALRNRQRIAIFADYDVDGGGSAALLTDWLRQMGRNATLYVPDRISEGYGPNDTAMTRLAAAHDLIICVDCGTLSHGPIAAAKAADVIVLDHHQSGETLPPAVAVVNPNRQDEDGALGHLCATAVVFLMLVETNRQLREAGGTGPDLMMMLDLVALATITDVVPLVGVNRAFVRQGLRVMAQRRRAGLAALADIARMDGAPTSYHLGFLLGPRVNAGGRIGQADLGARLLATEDPAEAAALAERLDRLNADRREIEARICDAAFEQAERRGLEAPVVWAAKDGWHPGVVGIVAARLKEITRRPAVVIGFNGNDGKGSGRSVNGVDLGAAVQRLVAEGLLVKGGGHRMAAGLSVTRDQLEPAMARLGELLQRRSADDAAAARLKIDGALMPGAATAELIEQIEAAGPFGAGAPAPRFAFPEQVIRFAKRVGETHLKLSFSDSTGPAMDAIAFGAFDGPLGPALENHGGARFHL
ncbi:MAG: single-stranded-DNA-specific exonuclease RecJ, partial [Pseudomonadota bacterium]